MRALALAAALAACSSSPPGKPVPAPGKPAVADRTAPPQLDPIIDKAISDGHLLGLAVAIVEGGKVVVEKGYGFTDLDRTRPVTLDTSFAIGSLSKQFTAVAVLRLVEDGKLKLSDRAATYLPAITGDVTIQELVWQTAGLAEYAWGINVGKTPDELIRIIGAAPPDFAPGTKWAYSNTNYYLLGRIIEVASKQSYADYLKDQVLARAGLTSTRVCGSDADARPSTAVGGTLAKGEAFDPRFYGGAGAICSTAHDLLRWQDALFGGKVLSPASLTVLTTPGSLADGTAIDYAGGLVVDHVSTHRQIWHNGGMPGGYESLLAWFPDDRLQIVLLTNTTNEPPGATLTALAHSLAIEQLHVEYAKALDRPLGPDELHRFIGRFSTGPIAAVITVDGDHLHVHVDGGVDARMLSQGAGRFALDGHPGVEYRFVLAAQGPATGLEVWRDGAKVATLEPEPAAK